MKWQQRLLVITGLNYWHILLNLIIIATLIIGWISNNMILVCFSICLLYIITVLLMLVLQRFSNKERWQTIGDILEELTTTWYLEVFVIFLWLLSKFLQNKLIISLVGLLIFAGPFVLLLSIKNKNFLIF